VCTEVKATRLQAVSTHGAAVRWGHAADPHIYSGVLSIVCVTVMVAALAAGGRIHARPLFLRWRRHPREAIVPPSVPPSERGVRVKPRRRRSCSRSRRLEGGVIAAVEKKQPQPPVREEALLLALPPRPAAVPSAPEIWVMRREDAYLPSLSPPTQNGDSDCLLCWSGLMHFGFEWPYA
jgi:hypothetical protein